MKTEVKNLEQAKKQIRIEVSGDVVKNKFEEVFKKVGQEAKVKGFRPGHVPRDILEKEFSGAVHEQVARELVPELYDQAVQKEGLSVCDLPEISEVKLDRASMSFTATVEITPEITVKNYKGIKIEYPKSDVKADELKRQIDAIKEQRKAETLDDNAAKELGYPSLAELEQAVSRQIAVQKDNASRHQIEHQVIEALTKGVDVKLPQSLVNRQLEEMLRNTRMELAMRGMPKDKIAEQEPAIRKDLEERAREQVKVYLILQAIARKEQITGDDQMAHKVMEFLYRNADWKIKE